MNIRLFAGICYALNKLNFIKRCSFYYLDLNSAFGHIRAMSSDCFQNIYVECDAFKMSRKDVDAYRQGDTKIIQEIKFTRF
jgi:hypothetical protein